MRQRTSHKAHRYFTPVFYFISITLFLLTWTGIHALGAQEFRTPGSGAIARKTSPYEEKGKERDMVDNMFLTMVHDQYKGDAFFPQINPFGWDVDTIEEQLVRDGNRPPYSIYHFKKRAG